ncbi:asparaginase [Candidatus Parcubacteria bacterium]|nr:asparaginase [Candidatus Parcubacteria bacterium]
MTKNNKLHFIITGGTIDSYYDGTKDTAITNEHSVVPKFVKILKLYEDCKFTEVCMKDSRDLNGTDRKNILETVKNSDSKRIIITHGTYTLPDTARYLQAQLKDHGKVIIFVCSMIPLEGFTPTDAGFNMGYAVAKSQELSEGIYVCMNGKLFVPDEIVKTLSEGRFGSIYTK